MSVASALVWNNTLNCSITYKIAVLWHYTDQWWSRIMMIHKCLNWISQLLAAQKWMSLSVNHVVDEWVRGNEVNICYNKTEQNEWSHWQKPACYNNTMKSFSFLPWLLAYSRKQTKTLPGSHWCLWPFFKLLHRDSLKRPFSHHM